MDERRVLHMVLLDVPPLVPGLHLWRQHVELVEGPDGRRRKVGIAGMADVSGVYEPYGWRVEIECKRPGAKLSPKQTIWAGNMMKWGCIWYMAATENPFQVAEDLERLIEAKRRGR